MTVKNIVLAYLISHGYDGLWTDECGCKLDDLMPCAGAGGAPDGCEPGYLLACDCEVDSEEPCPFHIGPKEKP